MYILVQNKFTFALNSVFCVLELENKGFVQVYGLCGGLCGDLCVSKNGVPLTKRYDEHCHGDCHGRLSAFEIFSFFYFISNRQNKPSVKLVVCSVS